VKKIKIIRVKIVKTDLGNKLSVNVVIIDKKMIITF